MYENMKENMKDIKEEEEENYTTEPSSLKLTTL